MNIGSGGSGRGGGPYQDLNINVDELVRLIEIDQTKPPEEPRKKDDVRRILRRIAARLHPDANVGLDPEAQKVLTAAFVELMTAYERMELHALAAPNDPWTTWLGLMRATVPKVGAPQLGRGGDRKPPAPPATTLVQLADEATALERRIADAEKRLGEVEQKIADAEEKALVAPATAAPPVSAALVRRRRRAQQRGLGFFIGALLTGVGALLGAVTKPDENATLDGDARDLPDDTPGQGRGVPKSPRAAWPKRPGRRRRRQ